MFLLGWNAAIFDAKLCNDRWRVATKTWRLHEPRCG